MEAPIGLQIRGLAANVRRIGPGYSDEVSVFARAVVGVDGTEWGFEALRQTLVLAPPDAAVDAVTALHTGPAARTGFDAARWVDILITEAEAARTTAASILAGRPGADARVVDGEALTVLRRARDEANATLVAVGGRHSSRFLGIMLGDTATALLHDAACSVLLARPRSAKEWSPEKIVVGLDASASAHAALAVADDIAARLGGSVECVYATGGNARPDDGWAARVDSWVDAEPVTALLERSRGADLLVVGSRGLGGLRALGSVSERVAHSSPCSVVVVHEETAGDR